MQHCWNYINGTRGYTIELSWNNDLEAFKYISDAAYADHLDRKSTKGYIYKLFKGLLDNITTNRKELLYHHNMIFLYLNIILSRIILLFLLILLILLILVFLLALIYALCRRGGWPGYLAVSFR